MNNSSLTNADGATHLKVVVVSLAAAILMVGVGILAKPTFSDGGVTASRLAASGPVIRAGKPITTAADYRIIR